MHAPSQGLGIAAWYLAGAYEVFLARIGLVEQDWTEFSSGGLIFRVYLDKKLV